MCGVVGFAWTNKKPDFRIAQLAGTIQHRGPDEFGSTELGTCILANRRLSIIDIEHGHQPLFNEDKSIAVVFNGQIYNYLQLRERLIQRKHVLNSQSDGEVISHLYEEYGDEFVNLLQGMFAIALWDSKREKLLLFRDRFGKKPLLYGIFDGALLFASELKVFLTHIGFGVADVSSQAVVEYLTYGYTRSPNSIIEQVKKIPPGHFLVFHKGQISLHRYFQLVPSTELSESNSLMRLDELFTSAVEKRLMSERTLGAFLSGGVDSSLVVSKMMEILQTPVKTFSISFADSKYDESEHARLVSNTLGTEHFDIRFHSDLVTEILYNSIDFYDEPFADSSSLPTFLLSQFASEQVVVALSGDGGDEAFGGYERYRLLSGAARISFQISTLSNLVPQFFLESPLLTNRVKRILRRAREVSSPDQLYRMFMTLASRSVLESIAPSLDFLKIDQKFLDEFSGYDESLSKRANRFDLDTYLPDDLMYKVDMASMAHSLEVRSPFLDHEIVEFGLGLLDEQRISGKSTKILLKEYARKRLPHSIIDRPKMGFGIPRRTWMNRELKPVIDDVFFSSDSYIRAWLDVEALKNLYQQFRHDGSHDGLVWAVMQLELWGRNWLSRKT